MDNREIAAALGRVADLLEIQGANRYRIRAYRNAARSVASASRPLGQRLAAGEDLTRLPAIGREMAAHIGELVATGELALLRELASQVPETLIEVVALPGVGPRKAARLWRELGVATVAELAAAARRGEVAALPGFGQKSEAGILAAIDRRRHAGRVLLSRADEAAVPLLDHLRGLRSVRKIELAGSLRRRRETVGDLDVLVAAARGEPVIRRFITCPGVAEVESAGDTRATVRLRSGIQVDLRVVPAPSWGAAMVYFTGSKAHSIKLRQRALERGLKMSEYGVFRREEGDEGEQKDPPAARRVAGSTERAVYRSLGLPWIPPELREDRGEIAAAERRELPRLIELADLRGDLQMHTTWSDGRDRLESMVAACETRGYEYLAITDHSPLVAVTGGLDARRLALQRREIDRVQARHPGIRILRGQEVDVRPDGSLDQTDEALAGLEVVVAGVHTGFDLPASRQTRRLVRALEHPAVRILAHPTGRKIGQRPPMEYDLEEVLRCAAERGVALELNALPVRLDLKDTHLMRARELGVDLVVSTDAHSVAALDLMRYGIDQARRAWLEAKHVVNTRPLAGVLEWLGGD